jgi:hypothetical protein
VPIVEKTKSSSVACIGLIVVGREGFEPSTLGL